MIYQYFFFKPLSLDELVNGLKFSKSADPKVIKEAYVHWLMDYCRKAQLFYQSQYRKHEELALSSFCKSYYLPDYDDPINYNLEFEWRTWRIDYKLDDHYEEYKSIIKGLSSLRTSIRTSQTSNSIESEDAITTREIDGIWFNRVISNSTIVAEELKTLPYERYLLTPHWKKIRAAMLLINKAVCQAKDCSIVGESWYGGTGNQI